MQPTKGQWKGELINDLSEAVWAHLARGCVYIMGYSKAKAF